MSKEIPFQDCPIPPYSGMVIQAIKKQSEPDKITLQDLAESLKEMGLKDAYRKVQNLPRTSTCRIDSDLIIEVYAQGENLSASTASLLSGETSLEIRASEFSSKDISVTHVKQKRKIIKTVSYVVLEKLLSGKKPLNIFIDGDSGLGKSMSVIDIMKKKNREVIRFNCSFATDVDDFLGGFRLINGQTVFIDGPVPIAQERGAVLLLDEMDACDPKILFEIQSVLEGNGVYLKKVNRYSHPAPGFQSIATGNTKGRGDLTGDFSGTNILNKSFLDRFDASMTWAPPTVAEIKKILSANCELDANIINALSSWYGQILEARDRGAVTQILGTRRIQSIADMAENFGVTKITDKALMDAANFGTNQFDEELKGGFMELLDRMIAEEKEKQIPEASSTDILGDDAPF